MVLSILIPTYNRSKYLEKNIHLLTGFIAKGQLTSEVEIVISNNCSPDNTDELVESLINKNPSFSIRYFKQSENIGLENNALFVLKQAKGEYVMYLGDDDYIDYNYLIQAVEYLNKNPNTYNIIPSYVPVDFNGEKISAGRDVSLLSSLSKKGFENCVKNSWRGHQLSGLILKCKNLHEAYLEAKVNNIYPFIYFVAYNCMRGNTYHLTQYPISITQPGQENKDWNYGEDGLLNEVFDNYSKLKVNYFAKTILQLYFFKRQPWRLWNYRLISNLEFMKAFCKILTSKNSTLLFKMIFPLFVILKIIKGVLSNIIEK